eukprot:3296241-Prorocentrum_lima.AAC.1
MGPSDRRQLVAVAIMGPVRHQRRAAFWYRMSFGEFFTQGDIVTVDEHKTYGLMILWFWGWGPSTDRFLYVISSADDLDVLDTTPARIGGP